MTLNTNKSYPYSDRLLEYLSGNVIDSFDKLPDNIMRVQEVMYKNKIPYRIYGAWDSNIAPEMYTYNILQGYKQKQITNNDSLGYIDKQIETTYASADRVTLADINIYNDRDTTLSGGHLNG